MDPPLDRKQKRMELTPFGFQYPAMLKPTLNPVMFIDFHHFTLICLAITKPKWLKRWANEVDQMRRVRRIFTFVQLSGMEAINKQFQSTF
jgi:hypothetical protein